MKIRDIDITANMSWSPKEANPIYLATGTAAQQLDATFSTNSALEIYSLDLSNDAAGQQMAKVASHPVDHRYHKIIWGSTGISNQSRPNGIIVGGLDQGIMNVYDAHKLINGQRQDAILETKDKHTGAVQALDFNPFQNNLLASGASESEIFIWDINKMSAPMSPGAKSQPFDDVRCLAWNKQVQHILGTTFASRCVVWDLRKNDPIIKLSDSTNLLKCKVIAWHPEVATQLCLASEDDHNPVVQIWDLRLASSPIRTLESHQKGILSVAWCNEDSDLLLSCGKDNRILCWNPNSTQPGGELLCEIPTNNQWIFDVSWCPRNPTLIGSSSFDGHVSVYSLMGGNQEPETTPAIADSFPGLENMQPMAAPVVPSKPVMQLKKPPNWLKRPCGASFGFGGRLVSFGSTKQPATQQQPAHVVSTVQISKVITEPELVERSQKLEVSIQNKNLYEFCDLKVNTSDSNDDGEMWKFIRANYSQMPRYEFLNLLGYNSEEMSKEIVASSGVKIRRDTEETEKLACDLSGLNTTDDREGAFEIIAAKSSEEQDYEIRKSSTVEINTDNSEEGLLNRSLLAGNIELAIELCLKQNKTTDAIILAAHGGPALLEKTRKRYFAKDKSQSSHLIEAVVTGDWISLTSRCTGENWKEALIAAITYASDAEFSSICTNIGDRLANNVGGQMIAYICAGNLDKVVECWMKNKATANDDAKALQDLIEVVMTLKLAIEQAKGEIAEISTGPLSEKLAQYANLLASQGALNVALSYLENSNQDQQTCDLRRRLGGALGRKRNPTNQSTPGRHMSRRASSNAGSYSISKTSQRVAMSPLDSQQTPFQQAFGITPTQHQQPQVNTNNFYNPNMHMNNSQTDSYSKPPNLNNMPYVPDQGGPGHTPPVSDGAGWNDPPPLTFTKPKIGTKSVTSSAVTQPFYNPNDYNTTQNQPAPPMTYQNPAAVPPSGPPPTSFQHPAASIAPQPPQQQLNQPNYSSDNQFYNPIASYGAYNPGGMSQGFSQYTPDVAMPGANPAPVSTFVPSSMGNSGMPEQPSAPAPIKRPEPPVEEKAPIPQEHVELQVVFDSLRNKCLGASNHPQIKRKLDDVGKKLEVLYDKLRSNTLTETTLESLHALIGYLKASDYANGLAYYTSMVSGPGFSEMASFMPSLKVLIQLCQQHSVFY